MSCTNPIYAIDYGIKSDGKHRIKILGRNPKLIEGVYSDTQSKSVFPILMLPCGQCESCLKQRAKVWAIRCCLEASLYSDNYFVTLTYDDLHNPGFISKKDFRKFIKNVRNKFGYGIRFFGCGEYGTTTQRPHYHLILFNLKLDDVKFYSHGSSGSSYFVSKVLQECWPYGFITLGDVTFASANYVARYCQKKVGTPSFISMSNHPGIGAAYFDKKKDIIYDCDKVYLPDGSVSQPPRYFDKLLSKIQPDVFENIKSTRISNANARTFADIVDHSLLSVEGLFSYEKISVHAKELNKKRGVL